MLYYLFIFLNSIFREAEGREKEGEIHPCVADDRAPPAGDPALNPGMCSDWELNLRPFGSQARTQSTELYQSGHNTSLNLKRFVVKSFKIT